ncbi:MAG: PorT family protein [Chitinispirillaceae bacterium]|nr:PorT family protein [Chitinispirillaceae bacterium]
MRLLLPFAVMIAAGLFFAEPVAAKGNMVGIKAGLNLSRPWCPDKSQSAFYDTLGMKPGLITGVVIEFRGNSLLSFQPEILFSMKGAFESQASFGIDYTRITSFHYIEFPLLLKVNIPVDRAVPNLYAGPAVGFRVSVGGYNKYGDQRSEFSDQYKKILEDNTNPVDFGLAMGGGFEILAGTGSVVIDFRYTLGFVKIFRLNNAMRIEGWTGDDVAKDRNGVFSMMIGYKFGLEG